jgi:DNA-binding MarR family transcriptional regulator
MSTPANTESELGWALGTVTRNYLKVAGAAVSDVPGGPRGYLVLATLGRGEPSTQVALAQHLGVDRTMMTYLLDDLEDAGLVDRRPDPADRRARRVTLTDTGRARLAELMCGLHSAEDDLLQPLDPEERTQLRDLLRRLATAMAPANPCEVAEQVKSFTTTLTRSRRRSRR